MPRRNHRKYAAAFLLGGVLGVVYLVYSVFTSASSTAAIGLLFLPLYFLAGALALAVPAAAAFTTWDIFRGERSTNKLLLALSAWAVITYTGAAGVIWKSALEEAGAPGAPETSLKRSYNRWLPFGKISVQIAAAENPSVTSGVLRDLWTIAEGSVKAKILENPKTPADILDSAARSQPDYFLHSALAANPALSPEMIGAMIESCTRPDAPNRNLLATYVLANLARRDDLSAEHLKLLLEEARRHPAYFFVFALANSPKVTCEQISEFLSSAEELTQREVSAAQRRKGCK